MLRITSKLLTGKKPPDEINDIDKFKEIKDLKSNRFNTIKIINVKKT